MVSIRRARRWLNHQPVRLSWALGVLLALSWLMIAAAPFLPRQQAHPMQAALLQQDTPSPSPTESPSPSPSLSLTASQTVTPTLTSTAATGTATPTGSPAASLTATLTSPPAPSATWTLPFATPIQPTPEIPTTIPPPIEPGPTATPSGPTATLVPLPSITYQFPGVTPRGDLLSLAQPTAAQVLPKGQSPLALRLNSGGGWLLFFLVFLWGALVAWFIVTQIIARKR